MALGAVVVFCVLVLVFAATARALGRIDVTAPIAFVAAGALLSIGLPELDERAQEALTLLTEMTLALILFHDAAQVRPRQITADRAVMARLLLVGLPLTIVAGALAGIALFAELALIEAVLLAIVLAPTDAALGQAVVTDPRVPSRVRQGLNVESGLNDGICVPLLLIAIAIAEADEGAIGNGEAVELVLEEIGYGALGGVVAGLAAAAVVRV